MNQTPIALDKLSTEAVEYIFQDCLWEPTTGMPMEVTGVLHKVMFDQTIIYRYQPMIAAFLDQLPASFKTDQGGGMSFLMLCEDKNGNQWADLHDTMDKLVCLGKAIGNVITSAPYLNHAMPGGMPYVFIKP